ncbi:hypothetical protein V8C86DRAFT_1805159, partial [Haematococcus lacustris]
MIYMFMLYLFVWLLPAGACCCPSNPRWQWLWCTRCSQELAGASAAWEAARLHATEQLNSKAAHLLQQTCCTIVEAVPCQMLYD